MKPAILAGLVAALALLAQPALAQGVTSNDFRATSTSDKLHESCKLLRISSAQTLTGECAKVANETVSSHENDSIDLGNHVACVTSTNELDWGNASDDGWHALSSATGLAVTVDSAGKYYLFEADCDGTGPAAATELNLSNRLKNDTTSGSFSYSSTDLI